MRIVGIQVGTPLSMRDVGIQVSEPHDVDDRQQLPPPPVDERQRNERARQRGMDEGRTTWAARHQVARSVRAHLAPSMVFSMAAASADLALPAAPM